MEQNKVKEYVSPSQLTRNETEWKAFFFTPMNPTDSSL